MDIWNQVSAEGLIAYTSSTSTKAVNYINAIILVSKLVVLDDGGNKWKSSN